MTLRGRVHAELWRPTTKSIASPIAQTALDGLKNATPAWPPLRSVVPGTRTHWSERSVLVVGVVGCDPGAGQANLKVVYRLLDRRPDGEIEPHARTVVRATRRPRRSVAHVSAPTSAVRCDDSGAPLVSMDCELFTLARPGQDHKGQNRERCILHKDLLLQWIRVDGAVSTP